MFCNPESGCAIEVIASKEVKLNLTKETPKSNKESKALFSKIK